MSTSPAREFHGRDAELALSAPLFGFGGLVG
jgi:hypothetical protein